jgi:trimethylamine--corrinoid protein Co-methyltransferase
MLELGMTVSSEQIVIDNDIIGMARMVVEGIEVNETTLAVDSIKSVGAGGDFLALDETRDLINIQSNPTLIDRNMRGTWQSLGGKDLAQAARDKVDEILKTHEVAPIDSDVLKDMEEVMKRADKAALEGR